MRYNLNCESDKILHELLLEKMITAIIYKYWTDSSETFIIRV